VAIESVIIKSSSNSAELQLSERNGLFLSEGSEYYRVTLKAKDIVASTKIYAFEPHSELWRYFEDLAVNWRGWVGEKQWNSLEGEFTISSESDAPGHIEMDIVLKSGVDWSVQTAISLDVVQLEDISSKLKQFFSEQNYPANL
jgi:hypothetical protein